jgi:DUF1680 family protein
VIPDLAHPLPLSDVRLTGGPLKTAQELDEKTLLALEPDRMLYYLRERAGLKPKTTNGYGGWDGGRGKQLTGHIAGHYLSGVSMMYAATGNPEFKKRADYIVKELKEIQGKQGDGYIGALTDAQGKPGKEIFQDISKGNIRSGGFDLNGLWSPWYVEHKIFAGLRDAYRLTGNKMALDVEKKFAAWAGSIVNPLTDEQIQGRRGMLGTEFGGMNEVLVDLYADTGDKRWLTLSEKFEHRSLITPLSQNEDVLGGKHGNTLVPKILGELDRYIYTGNKTNGTAAIFAWNAIVDHHTFSTGGHGYDEYFGPPDQLSKQVDGSGQRSQDLRTCESCNVYNMIKMTRRLFAIEPKDRYAEFHERALFNHVLSSINLTNGQVCYMVPIGLGVQHEYQGAIPNSFTCCVGSAFESHALHADGIYYENGNKLWVNIFAPTTADWKSQGVKVTMDTTFPAGDTASIKLEPRSSKQLVLAVRRPDWAGEGFSVKVNGEAVKDLPKPGNYVEIKRTWKKGDTVDLVLPKVLHGEPLVDNPDRMSLMWGPLVLAGDLGTRGGGGGGGGGGRRGGAGRTNLPVIVTADKAVGKWMQPVAGESGAYTAKAGNTGAEITFKPFYQMSGRRYGIYWDVYSPTEWTAKSPAVSAEQEKMAKLKAATVGYVQPGEMQPETDANFQGEDTTPVRVNDQAGRHGTKWFSFDLPVDASHPMSLIVTYNSDEAKKRNFDILADGERLKLETVEKTEPSRFFDLEYNLPADLVKGKQKVTIKFESVGGSEIASVFGVRMIRADAER